MSAEDRYAGLRRHSAETNALVKSCLKTALFSLMKEKSSKELSVAGLCRRAGVSRMAFYRNYGVIDDLFREAAEDLSGEILRAAGSPFRRGTGQGWYEQAFRLTREHRDEVAVMLSEEFQFAWMKVVNAMALHNPSFSAEKRIQRLIWCGGFENIVAHWLSHGMAEPPEEMAAYCVRYLPVIVAGDEPEAPLQPGVLDV